MEGGFIGRIPGLHFSSSNRSRTYSVEYLYIGCAGCALPKLGCPPDGTDPYHLRDIKPVNDFLLNYFGLYWEGKYHNSHRVSSSSVFIFKFYLGRFLSERPASAFQGVLYLTG